MHCTAIHLTALHCTKLACTQLHNFSITVQCTSPDSAVKCRCHDQRTACERNVVIMQRNAVHRIETLCYTVKQVHFGTQSIVRCNTANKQIIEGHATCKAFIRKHAHKFNLFRLTGRDSNPGYFGMSLAHYPIYHDEAETTFW